METIEIRNLKGEILFSHSRESNTTKATLEKAASIGADLRYANLSGADLSGANLSGAYLRDADLREANLRGANLRYANLSSANLGGADNIPFIPLACPSEGEFIGWKKVGDYVIKLRIPADAKRCSATTSKCRCDKAEVISIIGIGIRDNESIDSIVNDRYDHCEYTVGEMVYPDTFDENRWNECSNGIHFFINKQEAINYI